MARKKHGDITESGAVKPALFGQKHSSRDYSNPECWGKNQFNSSFPASLMAYMAFKGVNPVYIKVDKLNHTVHDYITPTETFGVDPLSDEAYYNYEAGFPPFEIFYKGQREKIDLVMLNAHNPSTPYNGLEVKLTALPDNTTKNNTEDKYGCEIVMRPPTICFLACSICSNFMGKDGRSALQQLLSGVSQIRHWEEPVEVASIYSEIEAAVMRVSSALVDKQIPLIMQPVWKTKGSKMILADDCLDMFVWSNLAIIQMCKNTDRTNPNKINRFQRAIIWIYLMLFEFADQGWFDHHAIMQNYSFGFSCEKIFTLNGVQSNNLMSSPELTNPRITKEELSRIVRFDKCDKIVRDSVHPLISSFDGHAA